ncbi:MULTISPECIES: hypothetical protein [unclassified Mucilaginibacter]|uniref:hypothetical protein n=1 Tax=unclassified Mucilaginibacter TaxID=2617802 RepID=UPI002AC993F2|nr:MULTISPECIES: hypothetical protein [unclassified Mucilaginibacter]MEB0261688.1 hypothetical protein [Mucilaginibacter sp. 10I4]MEB0278338.1 hypothetical protein [Mucilaginibacter sp. 10B2]MEB0301041.1 hypothetical protein [Mucilaginibacter sp. 5C4]WPX23983.1 hypothetical protein RHM67_01665 [Mucilaginibacter sp. 5C4]
MKRTGLIIFFIFFTVQLKAQRAIIFKYKYLPNHNYVSTVLINNNGVLNFKGSPENLATLKAEGAENPMTIGGATSMEFSIKTGAYKGLTFPVTITYNSLVNKQYIGDKELPLPKSELINKSIYGHSDNTGRLNVDSIDAKSKKDSLLQVVSGIFKSVNKQITFPEKGLVVGDLFTQNMPLNIPIMGGNVPVENTITYKLTEIKGDVGYFDVSQKASFNMTTSQGPLKITGEGKGKMIFSVKDSFPTHYDSDIVLHYGMEIANLDVDGEVKIVATYDTKIN